MWIFMILYMTGLYFIIPNFIGGVGGHMSMRLAILMYFCLFIRLSLISFPVFVKQIYLSVSVVISLLLLNYYFYVIKNLNKATYQVEMVSQYIRPNSVVLPIYASNYWMMGHFSNYIGINKPLVILENYETAVNSIPLVCREDEFSDLEQGNYSRRDICIHWREGKGFKDDNDYIFIFGFNPDDCSTSDVIKLKNASLINKVSRTEIWTL